MGVLSTDNLIIERSGTLYKATAADVAALGGGGGGGVAGGASEWTEIVLANDVVTSVVAAADVPAFNFTPAPNKTYFIEAFLMVRTTVTTSGARPGVRFPTTGVLEGTVHGSVSSGATGSNYVTDTAGDNKVVSVATTGHHVIDASVPAMFNVILKTGANPTGIFGVTFHGENGSATYTLRAGSILRYRTILEAGTVKYPITVGPTPPASPSIGDLWVDTN